MQKRLEFGGCTADLALIPGHTIPPAAAETFRMAIEFAERHGYYPSVSQLAELAGVASASVVQREDALFRTGTLRGSRRPRRIETIDPVALLDREDACIVLAVAMKHEDDGYVERGESVAPATLDEAKDRDVFGLANVNISERRPALQGLGVLEARPEGVAVNPRVWVRHKCTYWELSRAGVPAFSAVREQFTRPSLDNVGASPELAMIEASHLQKAFFEAALEDVQRVREWPHLAEVARRHNVREQLLEELARGILEKAFSPRRAEDRLRTSLEPARKGKRNGRRVPSHTGTTGNGTNGAS